MAMVFMAMVCLSNLLEPNRNFCGLLEDLKNHEVILKRGKDWWRIREKEQNKLNKLDLFDRPINITEIFDTPLNFPEWYLRPDGKLVCFAGSLVVDKTKGKNSFIFPDLWTINILKWLAAQDDTKLNQIANHLRAWYRQKDIEVHPDDAKKIKIFWRSINKERKRVNKNTMSKMQ